MLHAGVLPESLRGPMPKQTDVRNLDPSKRMNHHVHVSTFRTPLGRVIACLLVVLVADLGALGEVCRSQTLKLKVS